jgi:hypothetical protein
MGLSRKHWLVMFLVGVSASVVGYYIMLALFKSTEYAVTASIVLLAVSLSTSYGQFQKFQKRATCQLYDRTKSVCTLGIRKVHKKAEDTIRDCLNDIQENETYRWLGFSAFNVASLTRGEDIIKKKARGTCNYEFFTLNPKAERIFRLQASWEGRDLATIRLNVKSASNFIASYMHAGLNVKNPTHDFTPTFRVVMLGDRRIHVGFYPPVKGDKAQCGIDSPELELINTGTEMCIFPWFQWFYSKNLEYAKTRQMDKKILKAKFENPSADIDAICETLRAQGSQVTPEEVRRTLREYWIRTD